MSSAAYVDSCVLLATYIHEERTEEARQHLRDASFLYTSSLTYVEVLSVLGRCWRQRDLRRRRFDLACERFELEWRQMVVIPLELVLPSIPRITRSHSLKAGDAIHLASASLFSEDLGKNAPFLTFDQKLGQAALEAGLNWWPRT